MAGESIGWKSELHIFDGTALVKLAGVTNITPPNPSLGEAEVTDLDAVDRYRSFIPTMRDPGTLEATLNYVGGSATDTLLRAAQTEADNRAWEVVYSDSDGTPLRKISGTGYVQSLSEPEISLEGVKQQSLSIRVSGAVTEAAVVVGP